MHRPMFATAWSAAMKVYAPSNPEAKVASTIGGVVARNIDLPNAASRWKNTCAVRMSYILNHCGIPIPTIRGKTVTGGDKRQYFFRVRDLIDFLQHCWGEAEVVEFPPSGGGALANKRGVILFEVSGWGDAQGHATLYNGIIRYDRCYFNEPEATFRTNRAHFGSLR
ncbi:type VI secretion system amidase effector protein Tae4 [Caballeronia sp. LZ043]|uniref:type VI secretion system amidase effector protein Tae4 n=1 Tax=Caballeronia sp. LZ043 TaxID=3038569 RepID=UPI0028606CA0|nr:type VI secretion system amidase effector protein Tae4 [Caballeronia sp. LZ043]MDR5825051.1 type VI secretion system amidase effector protein Tae4 [Caballeronia sp. LZ043]